MDCSGKRKVVVHLIAGARPNFMKIAPVYHALRQTKWAEAVVVHTGQHYDINMSEAFFRDLGLREPDIRLGIGSGTHAEQTGQVMIAYEKVLMETPPDFVIVVGDVNSTLACALATCKVRYSSSKPSVQMRTNHQRPILAHLEAGLRSFDRTMPEEINRLVTDTLADILWTPSSDADENLRHEGVEEAKIERVGNIMIDCLEMLKGVIEDQAVPEELGLKKGNYGLVTLHRPSNVDSLETLGTLCRLLSNISRKIQLVFPVHPRTRSSLKQHGLMEGLENNKGLVLLEPLGYVRFMNLLLNCRFAITDSGGIQEEATYLGIPCLTMRPNTERPITLQGTNQQFWW